MGARVVCDCDGCCVDCRRRREQAEHMVAWRAGELRRHDDPTVTLVDAPPPGPWIARARCATAPTHMFFPERGDDMRPARQICAACPVLADCRQYALDAPSALQGVWAGMSARERRDARSGARSRWAS